MNLETEINHELWQAVRRSFESEAWSNAILDSIHFLSDAVRARTGLQSDGIALAGQAFGGKSPKLQLSKLETESDRNVQAGVEQLFRGLFQAVRNPRSHDRMVDTQADAEALILFVHYLLRLTGHARASFSLEEFVARVLEKNFVPNPQYAQLLVSEIPTRQRSKVALAVYQGKSDGDGRKLRYFFDAIIPNLSEPDAQELFSVISNELRQSNDERALLRTIQLLNPEYWLKIDEIARLRTENRIISDIQDGRFDRNSGKCLAGSLATWSTDLWAKFGLKSDAYRVVLMKLQSSSEESQDYALEFCFSMLDKLADRPSWQLLNFLVERLKAGDARFKRALDMWSLWEDQGWDSRLQKARESFQEAQLTPGEDDLPF